MLNLHRDKKNVRREPGRDGKILCDHRQDGNDEVHRLQVRSVANPCLFLFSNNTLAFLLRGGGGQEAGWVPPPRRIFCR